MMNDKTLITEEALDERLESFGRDMRTELRSEIRDMLATAEDRHRSELVRSIDGMRSGIEARLTMQDRDFEKRFRDVGNDIQLVVSAMAGLRDDLYGDPMQRSGPKSLYERLDEMDTNVTRQFQSLSVELVTRIDRLEKWIARRTAVEQSLIKLVKTPIAMFMRRFVPWAALAVAMMGAAVALAQVMG